MTDYIVIGAGSAGSAVAGRLSENPDASVVLLEAGGPDDSPFIHMPGGIIKLREIDVNWGYETVPQPNLKGRRLFWPRGKVLGGSSSINAMIYIRGHRADYDAWAQLGNRGWGYDDVLPYFRKAERNETIAGPLHGSDGPLNVAELRSRNPLSEVFLRAAEQAGFKRNPDFNGAEQDGCGFYQVTQKGGKRWSASVAYLRPAAARPNLRIVTKALVTRILIEKGRATGVEYLKDGKLETVRADAEIVLCGGAINSPQTLMLSGIGPADHLKTHGIRPLVDLPGVGGNLQDHLNVNVIQKIASPITYDGLDAPLPSIKVGLQYLLFKTGPVASNIAEAGGFGRSRAGVVSPDIQYHFLPVQVIDHARVKAEGHGITLHACALRPESSGRLRLASADPTAHPLIDPEYLKSGEDLRVLVAGLKRCRDIMAQSAFDPHRGAEYWPGAGRASDSELEEFVRETAETEYHPVGTCKMGADAMAVVDDALRVRGVERLRVADASIMPKLVSGNTNAPSIMIGEKAAAMIAEAKGG